MPGTDGPGARRVGVKPKTTRAKRRAPRNPTEAPVDEAQWTDGAVSRPAGASPDGGVGSPGSASARLRPPQTRVNGEPKLIVATDGTPVIRYPFLLRTAGNRVRLSANVEVLASDGGQVEPEAPLGAPAHPIRGWLAPSGVEVRSSETEAEQDADGPWMVDVVLVDDVMVRVDVQVQAI